MNTVQIYEHMATLLSSYNDFIGKIQTWFNSKLLDGDSIEKIKIYFIRPIKYPHISWILYYTISTSYHFTSVIYYQMQEYSTWKGHDSDWKANIELKELTGRNKETNR